MMTTERFPTWIRILDRMIRSLPNSATELPALRTVQDQLSRYLSHQEGQPDVMEQQFRDLASEHPDLLIASAEQVVREVFQLIDPEIERLKEAKQQGGLSAQDKKDGKAYIELLEECQRILGEMKPERTRVPAPAP